MTLLSTRLAVVVLDATEVTVVHATDGRIVRRVSWSPDIADGLGDALRALTPAPSGVVCVVGLGLLDLAEPDLPPIDAAARRALLWRDADRYFPIEGEVAVALDERCALAVPSARYARWISACDAIAPVRAVLASPSIVARLIGDGTAVVAAGAGERGLVHAGGGRLLSVRRAPLDGRDARAQTDHATVVDSEQIARAAAAWVDAPSATQVLDATHASRFTSRQRRRWMTSLTVAATAVAFLLWSASRARESTHAALRERATALAAQAAPADAALSRLANARTEIDLLREAAGRAASPDAPLSVLAELGRVLPRDAFVQRLEWDGRGWRVDGTADNAPRLVPLLDGDTRFRDVRIVAPSQRFLDVGRPRESFAITFRMRAPSGGVNGAP